MTGEIFVPATNPTLISTTNPVQVSASWMPSVMDLAGIMFLSNYSFGVSGSVSPLDLGSINANLDKWLQSAAKAFLSGNISPSAREEYYAPVFTSMSTNATTQVQKLALVASRPFLVSLAILIVILEACLLRLLYVVDPREVKASLFNLETLLRVTRGILQVF
ncbi:hypothetical protein NP233_g4375 [Leucocoprinus birnbaumii]|uniref:Uncharacterized protein n=1 Tax=Leucocoprinus birnbaumii TaxID=56174 RepID=A0AAD5VV64_9AGAR|nr:hypothetical protein NP233_g4375 [Leucocoprinus birnbaumii]